MSWWSEGEPLAGLPMDDRGLQYGDGLFETIAVRGGDALFLDRHLSRLARDAIRLRIPVPSLDELAMRISTLCACTPHGALKVILTRGSGSRGYAPPATCHPRVLLGLFPTQPSPAEPVRVRWCSTTLAIQPALAGIKHLNRLEQVLARAEWTDTGTWQEGLMCDTEGWVIEATQANLFIIENGGIVTPFLKRCGVAGIMREMVREIANEAGIRFSEERVARERVLAAEEVFLSNTLSGIRPVSRVDGADFRAPGRMTRALQAALIDRGWRA